jgi:hypothetical protein
MSNENKEKLDLFGKILMWGMTTFIAVMLTVVGFFARDAYKTSQQKQDQLIAEVGLLKESISKQLVSRENHEIRLATAEKDIAQVQEDIKNNSQDIDVLLTLYDVKRPKQ